MESCILEKYLIKKTKNGNRVFESKKIEVEKIGNNVCGKRMETVCVKIK